MSTGRRYEVLSVVGKGGFGTVYRARMHGEGGFSKVVALKVLNPEVEGISDVAGRLRDEGRMLGLVNHRAIVQADSLVELDGRWTVVMEYVDGVDLRAVVEQGPMPPAPALEITAEVAGALYAAWSAASSDGSPLRIQHRDIKPGNVCVTRAGAVKVLDFGIARAEFDDREAQTQSLAFGSLDYMSPERFEFICRPEGDVYALGALLYELLAGKRFGRASPHPDRHTERVTKGLDELVRINPDVDRDILDLLRDMLAGNADDRLSSAQVERRSLELARMATGPLLRVWSESTVPPLVDARPSGDDSLTGEVLVENSGAPSFAAGPAPIPTATIPDLAAAAHEAGDDDQEEAPSGRWLVALIATGTAIIIVASAVMALVFFAWLGLDGAQPAAVDSQTAASADGAESTDAEGGDASAADSDAASTLAQPSTEPEGPGDSAPGEADGVEAGDPATEPEAQDAAGSTTPTQPRATPRVSYGTVKVTGDATSVSLVRSGRTWSPGRVPVGRYRVVASFPDREPLTAGEIVVAANRTVTLACNAVFTRCSAQ